MESSECTVPPRKQFCFMFDGERHATDDRAVTPQEIRDIVGDVADDVPIVLVLDDGTQRTLSECDEVKLKHCRHFKRLPRFRRG